MINIDNNYLLTTLEKQNQILEKISHGIELNLVLEAIIFSVEELITDVLCSMHFFDEKDKSLINAIGPSLPDEYIDAINGIKIGPTEGSCGTAAFYGKTVIVSDISLDPLWDNYRDLSLSFGLKSCWSKPIFSSEQKLLGTFALYYCKPHAPSKRELDILKKFSYLAGIAIDKQQIEAKYQKYQLMAENLSDLLLIIDETGMITYASPSYKPTLGYYPEEMIGTNGFQYLPVEDLEYLQEEFGKRVQEKTNATKEIKIINKDGIFIPFEVTAIPVLDESGEVKNILMVSRDLRERKAIEQALKESEERYRLIVDLSPDAILVHFGGEIVYTNKSGANMVGVANPSDIIGTSLNKYIHPDYQLLIEGRLMRVLAGETEILEPTEIKVIKCDGDVIDVDIKSRVVKYNGKLGLQSIGRDITERKKNEDKIKFMAYHDNLTQLPNRLYFKQLLRSEIDKAKQSGEKMAILFMDIDNFKEVNDSIGHSLADEVLKMFSRRVSYCVPANAIMSRLSGDEFSMLLPNVKKMVEVEDITKNILGVCNHAFSLEGSKIKITISVGISLYPVSGQDPEELMKNSDLAMYIAKQKGKNTYQVFTDEVKENIVKKRKLGEDLKYAITDNQFLIYYQPIINVEKNTVSSVEALIRWNHPKNGLILPGEFIPLAEENGLIIQIGEWVLRNACLQIKQWHRDGLRGLALKVNLSVRQLEQENFVDMVASILNDIGFHSELLELEITESILMQNTERMIKILNKLKALNVKISLDDFGKGFSSLSYLTQFPFDILKIDRSFTQKMLTDDKSAAIVKMIINLAHQLNLSIVAEGVETEAQLRFLINNQCEEVQGFLFNKPLSVEDFEIEYLNGQLKGMFKK